MTEERWQVARDILWGLFVRQVGHGSVWLDKDVLAEGSRESMRAALRLLKS